MFRFLTTLNLVLAASVAGAHFPWLTVDQDNHGLLFFSESMLERDYHLPECVEQAEVVVEEANEESTKLSLQTVESEDFQGRRSDQPVASGAKLSTQIDYGVYHGTLLCYYVMHATATKEAPPAEDGLKLNATPLLTEHGVNVQVTWQGEPLAGAEITMTDSQGQQAKSKTNKRGLAKFRSLAEGPVGFLVGHTEKNAKGTFNDESYESKSHYLTLTTSYAMPSPAVATTFGPELPEPLASFGAAVSDGWLYVYSGHTGGEHEHSRENLSKHFCRLKLDGGQRWESLPMQTPLQGLPLVAHDGKLHRIGGLNHRNASDEDEDMHSTDACALFDPATSKWSPLPSLPAPRSSHDAVVIGDSIYVVGGWRLSGSSPGEWQSDALRLDLADISKGWQTIAQPTFHRRAIAAAHLDGKLVVIGGFKKDKGVVNTVNAYDPAADGWSELPEIPGRGIGGFGVSAWNLGGVLYASGMEGVVYALRPGADAWEKAAKFDGGRFFHRLLPAGVDALLVVAGASKEGHSGTVLRVALETDSD